MGLDHKVVRVEDCEAVVDVGAQGRVDVVGLVLANARSVPGPVGVIWNLKEIFWGQFFNANLKNRRYKTEKFDFYNRITNWLRYFY